MVYVISNGELFIRRLGGEFEAVSSYEKANKFLDKAKAENFFKMVPRVYRNIGYVIKEIEGQQLQNNINLEDYFKPDCMDNIMEDIINIQTFFRRIVKQKEYAEQQLLYAEKEILDILHAAEFYNLNASKGYSLYKSLHEARVKRRKYKDQITIIDSIICGGINDIVNGDITKKIKALDERKYRPRILDELFK